MLAAATALGAARMMNQLVGIGSIGDISEGESAAKDETIRYLHEYMHGVCC